MYEPELAIAEPDRLVYAFGPFRLDLRRECLTYGVERIALPDRLYSILLALVRANGSLVSREELHALIWPGSAVSDNNLSQHVYMLRRLLGERAGDRLYIATAHRKGFRFVARVRVVESETLETSREQSISEVYPEEPDLIVFRNFSRALKLVELGSGASLRSAVESLTEAVALDEQYAPAWIGLARAHLSLVQYGYCPKEVESTPARNAVFKALQIEGGSAAAHAVLANIMLFCDWDRRGAHREIDLAVQMNPESSVVRTSAAWLHAWTGYPKRAAMEARRALMSEPASTFLQFFLGRILIYCGDYAAAIEHLSEVIQSSAEYASSGRRWRAQALLMDGRPQDALLDLTLMSGDRAEDLAGRLALLGQAYASLDDKTRAERIYDHLATTAQVEFVPELCMMQLALALGDCERAVVHLEKAIRQKEPMLPLLRSSPALSPLNGSTAFKELMGAVGSCQMPS